MGKIKTKQNNVEVKQNNTALENDERVFASLMYVFPFQPFIYIMLRCTDYYTDFIKKHLKNSIILYLILFGITVIAIAMRQLNVSGTLQAICAVTYIVLFAASIILLIIICVKAFSVFKK